MATTFEEYYSMAHTPFSRDIPAGDIYRDPLIDDAAGRLAYSCRRRQFALLTGPAGSGKTTLLRHVRDKVEGDGYVFVYMSERALEPRMFYNSILRHLNYSNSMQYVTARSAVLREIDRLTDKRLIVMVDDAETMSCEMAEEIRFALNYKMDTGNPYALILSGTPALYERLKGEALSGTRSRVDMECRTAPLGLEQTHGYIKAQLSYAGGREDLFDREALSRIYKSSKGLPVKINRICRDSLLLASQCESDTVRLEHVESVLSREISDLG